MSAPEVSVVIPTRNRRERLRVAVRSALAQRNVELEVIIVDDASSDGSDAAIGGFDDPRVRSVRRAARGGVGAARNDGIERARGRWVAFLDDDDVWSPDKLSRQLAAARILGAGWAYGGEVVVDQELRVLAAPPPPEPEEVCRMLARYNSVPAGASNVVVGIDVLRRTGAFDPAMTTSEDWDLWIRLARDGPPARVTRPVVAISIHAGNASRDVDAMLREIEVIQRRYGLPVDRARHLRWAGWTALVDGRRRDARRYYLRAALAGDPSSAVRAAAVLVPGVSGRILRRGPAARSEGYVGEASAWLEEARTWLQISARA
jgi:glycosyltransferase involved in cell wall biosynthesis